MIIDFHTHTFPEKVAKEAIPMMEQEIEKVNRFPVPVKAVLDGTAKQLSYSLFENGIDLSVVLPVATSPKQSVSINQFAAKANEVTDETRIMSFGAIHPDNEDYKDILKDIKDRGIKGVKLHPDYQKVEFDDSRYLRIMEYAAYLDLIIVTHAGIDIGKPQKVYCTPEMICRVDDLLHYPKLVLAHLGGWNLWDRVEDKILGRNLYLDTAICFQENVPHIGKEQFLRFVQKHGSGKILFGTDSPWTDIGAGVSAISNMGLTKEEEQQILGENARMLLQI